MLGAMARTTAAADTAASGEERSRSWVFRFAPWIAALGGAAVVALMVVTTQPPTEQTEAEPAAISQDSTLASLETAKESPSQPLPARGAAPAPSQPAAQSRKRENMRQVPSPLAKDIEARQNTTADARARQDKAAQPLMRDEKTLNAPPAAVPPAAPAGPVQGQVAGAAPLVIPAGERAQESQRFTSARSAAPLDAAARVAAPPVFIQSADASTLWRIMAGTVIQYSVDAGATWTTQDVKVEAPLAAGSAPTATVCWLVGRQGTVFVTVDGRTWQRLTFPEPVDLIAIIAKDADTATVTAADSRSFTTTDRGRTWR